MTGSLLALTLALFGAPGLVPVFADGRQTAEMSAVEAIAAGYTVVDLGDLWAPRVLRAPEDAASDPGPAFLERFRNLAAGNFGTGPEAERPLYDQFLELYGIPPTMSVLRKRLMDDQRHRCRDAVDDAPLLAMTQVLRPWEDERLQRKRIQEAELLGARLERERARLALADLAAVGAYVVPVAPGKRAGKPPYAKLVAQHEADRVRIAAIRALQGHLRCERLMTGPDDGVFAGITQMALGQYQRLHMLASKGVVDAETRAALALDSRELDFRAFLRVLRERVTDAAGRIEDGSARNEEGQVLGRKLDAQAFRLDVGRPPMPDGAPDLVAEVTEAAAKALGTTSPEQARAFMERRDTSATTLVALRLPPPPAWQTQPMNLRAVIDRGDVFLAWPYKPDGKLMTFPVEQRPVLIVYARGPNGDVALIRWPTTIGGWQRETRADGNVVRKYKESPVGPRTWRRVVAAPAWIPPPSTPEVELVQKRPTGYIPNVETFGPGYASAYGLAMMVHERADPVRKGGVAYIDQGVRVHGSVSYASIGRGASHGCHRLFNHLALRLTGFVLSHRESVRVGRLPIRYGKKFNFRGSEIEYTIAERGYEYQLVPPISVEVLPGRVHRGVPRGMR